MVKAKTGISIFVTSTLETLHRNPRKTSTLQKLSTIKKKEMSFNWAEFLKCAVIL